MTPTQPRIITTAVGVLALITVTAGLGAMVSPRTFYVTLAPFPPYNTHLIHDVGASRSDWVPAWLLGCSRGMPYSPFWRAMPPEPRRTSFHMSWTALTVGVTTTRLCSVHSPCC